MTESKFPWHVYLLRCADGTLYCGATTDLARRVAEHNAGTGAKYTRSRRPVRLVASAPFADKSAALRAEHAVKRKPAARKTEFLASLAGTGEKLNENVIPEAQGLGKSGDQVYVVSSTSSTSSSPLTLAMQTTPIEHYQHKITKEEINELPLKGYEGDIRLIAGAEAANEAAREIAEEALLGFDTESRPSFKKGKYYLPSLIQIATSARVYIFQLSKTPFPESLKAVFENERILKTGVAVGDDVKDLQKLSPFDDAGFLDLGAVALKLKLETHGLRNLAAKFLGIRISKAARCTNWANPNLSRAQIRYAATDAWISRELYLRMHEAGLIPANGDATDA